MMNYAYIDGWIIGGMKKKREISFNFINSSNLQLRVISRRIRENWVIHFFVFLMPHIVLPFYWLTTPTIIFLRFLPTLFLLFFQKLKLLKTSLQLKKACYKAADLVSTFSIMIIPMLVDAWHRIWFLINLMELFVVTQIERTWKQAPAERI